MASDPPYTRRTFARRALSGAAGMLLASGAADSQDTPAPTEGELLAKAVPVNVRYTLSPAQEKQVASTLRGYPGGFGRARSFALPASHASGQRWRLARVEQAVSPAALGASS